MLPTSGSTTRSSTTTAATSVTDVLKALRQRDGVGSVVSGCNPVKEEQRKSIPMPTTVGDVTPPPLKLCNSSKRTTTSTIENLVVVPNVVPPSTCGKDNNNDGATPTTSGSINVDGTANSIGVVRTTTVEERVRARAAAAAALCATTTTTVRGGGSVVVVCNNNDGQQQQQQSVDCDWLIRVADTLWSYSSKVRRSQQQQQKRQVAALLLTNRKSSGITPPPNPNLNLSLSSSSRCQVVLSDLVSTLRSSLMVLSSSSSAGQQRFGVHQQAQHRDISKRQVVSAIQTLHRLFPQWIQLTHPVGWNKNKLEPSKDTVVHICSNDNHNYTDIRHQLSTTVGTALLPSTGSYPQTTLGWLSPTATAGQINTDEPMPKKQRYE